MSHLTRWRAEEEDKCAQGREKIIMAGFHSTDPSHKGTLITAANILKLCFQVPVDKSHHSGQVKVYPEQRCSPQAL